MEEMKLSEIEESEWITPDMESTFILVETAEHSTKDGVCVSTEAANKVLAYLNDEGMPPVAVVEQQVNKKPVLLATLGYEARAFQNSGIADILFAVDLGSTEEIDLLETIRQASDEDWIAIKDLFEIRTPDLTLVSDIIGAPFWGKNSIKAKPGKYQVRYCLYYDGEYEGDGPTHLFVRLDLRK